MNDDRTELARLLADPARHDLPGYRHHILRERFMQEIDETRNETSADVTGPPIVAPASRRRRRPMWTAVTAGALALVVALGAVSASQFGIGKFWAGKTEAGELLDRIALVAANSTDIPPADQIRDDQFVYIETYGGFAGMGLVEPSKGGTGALAPTAPVLHQRAIWLSVNGSKPGLLRDASVKPGDIVLDLGGGATSLNSPTFRYLTTLPTNPDLLLAKIYTQTWGAGPNPQAEAFTTIGDLMRESVVPPTLAAALYKAAARIPGITVVPDAVDARGRHGTAIGRVDGGVSEEWIFDKVTLQFLGERSVTTGPSEFGPAGTVTGSTAIVVRAIVDRAGQLPG